MSGSGSIVAATGPTTTVAGTSNTADSNLINAMAAFVPYGADQPSQVDAVNDAPPVMAMNNQ